MIAVSIINLFVLLFMTPINAESMASIGIFAVMGSIGLALRKETKHKQKEMEEVSTQYMIERVKNSAVLPQARKEEYTALIKGKPLTTVNIFISFLQEEYAVAN